MDDNRPLYVVNQDWPSSRNVVLDGAYFASRRHLIHALIEVDVTDVRKIICDKKEKKDSAAHSCQEVAHLIAHVEQPCKNLELPIPIEPSHSITQTSQINESPLLVETPISFTGFILKCVGEAVTLHPMMQAYRTFWGAKLIIPQPVDVATMIEATKGGVAVPKIIRDIQKKTVYQISEEMREAQENAKKQNRKLYNWWGRVPALIRRLIFWVILCRPKWIHQMMGTVSASSMGMFGKDGGSNKNGGSSFAVGYVPFHTMGVFIGGIATRPHFASAAAHTEEPANRNGLGSEPLTSSLLQEREYLSLTITFDHDIVDGAPAARFSNTLRRLIETGAQFF